MRPRPTRTRCLAWAVILLGPTWLHRKGIVGLRRTGILYADIDLSAIAVAKAAADPVGHYSRPDVTRLLLNKNPRRPVEQTAFLAETFQEPSLLEPETAQD